MRFSGNKSNIPGIEKWTKHDGNRIGMRSSRGSHWNMNPNNSEKPVI